ncbi:hypothetical protein Btru_068468 [Bulinus truncatus]|nr:hypothetical protein Btru_068468 [Bulinus truncatus]
MEPRNRANKLLIRRNSSLVPLVIPSTVDLEPLIPTENILSSGLLYDKQQTQEEGQELFYNFLIDQMQKQLVEEIHELNFFGVMQGYKNRKWARNGYNLRQMSNSLAESKERKWAQEAAHGVNLDMSKEQFLDLLETFLVRERITSKRIIFVFFFCSDLIIRWHSVNRDISAQYLLWSNEFIKNSISIWIFELGGWNIFFPEPTHFLMKFLKLSSIGVVFIIIIKYLKQNYL